jgi:hypothetical protein
VEILFAARLMFSRIVNYYSPDDRIIPRRHACLTSNQKVAVMRANYAMSLCRLAVEIRFSTRLMSGVTFNLILKPTNNGICIHGIKTKHPHDTVLQIEIIHRTGRLSQEWSQGLKEDLFRTDVLGMCDAPIRRNPHWLVTEACCRPMKWCREGNK